MPARPKKNWDMGCESIVLPAWVKIQIIGNKTFLSQVTKVQKVILQSLFSYLSCFSSP